MEIILEESLINSNVCLESFMNPTHRHPSNMIEMEILFLSFYLEMLTMEVLPHASLVNTPDS